MAAKLLIFNLQPTLLQGLFGAVEKEGLA
jgi:hypothetical protein